MKTTTAAMSGIRGKGKALRRVLGWTLGAGLAVLSAAAPALAQSAYVPAMRIDGEVITRFEFDQRLAFLTLLRAPGDVRALVTEQLVNEKLQMREARRAGIAVDDAAVLAGMEEFAARGNLTAEQFVALLGQAGVDGSTFRDFVAAGVTWREFVRARLLPKVAVSGADIDAAMAEAVAEPGLRVLLNEIKLPAGDPATRKASMARAQRLTGLDEKAFEDAARRFSVSPARVNYGRMKWLDVTVLPPAAGAAVRGLRPGQTTRPIEDGETITLYFMRDREEVSGRAPRTMLDYAALQLPGGASGANLDEAARIHERVTGCDDLYPIARRLGPGLLTREEKAEAELPAAWRAELDRLDPGEISTRLTGANGAMVLLMLCQRGNELPRSLTRDMVEEQLRNKRVSTMAQMLLDDLRANAFVETFR